jgi:hypothetical protein
VEEEDIRKEKLGLLAEPIGEIEEISDVEEDTGRESVVVVSGGRSADLQAS